MRRQPKRVRKANSQSGMTLVETLVAVAILLVVASGVLGLACVAVTTTENQGHLAARTAEYAQDKMEQLMALTFCDGTGGLGTDTTVFPAVIGNGTGLAGCTNLNAPIPTPSTGGGLNPSAPAQGYVDYLDATGTQVGANGNWEYIRVWQISVPAGTTGMKQITVKSQVKTGVGNVGLLPQSTVVALKSYLF
jgi:prepilin-type N-terminal cleavage/methylation domain-containing protein